jgi:hypothetical protein
MPDTEITSWLIVVVINTFVLEDLKPGVRTFSSNAVDVPGWSENDGIVIIGPMHEESRALRPSLVFNASVFHSNTRGPIPFIKHELLVTATAMSISSET